MKIKTILLTFICAFSACNNSAPDPAKASEFIEDYIKKTGNGDFSNLSDYYSEEMQSGESDSARAEKLTQINEALGPVQSFEKTESQEEIIGDEPVISMKYKVKHKLLTVTETYSVKLENGKMKIARQYVESIR